MKRRKKCLKQILGSLILSPHIPPLTPLGAESLSVEQREVLLWLFRPALQTEQLSDTPYLTEGEGEGGTLVEIGPRYTHSQTHTHKHTCAHTHTHPPTPFSHFHYWIPNVTVP